MKSSLTRYLTLLKQSYSTVRLSSAAYTKLQISRSCRSVSRFLFLDGLEGVSTRRNDLKSAVLTEAAPALDLAETRIAVSVPPGRSSWRGVPPLGRKTASWLGWYHQPRTSSENPRPRTPASCFRRIAPQVYYTLRAAPLRRCIAYTVGAYRVRLSVLDTLPYSVRCVSIHVVAQSTTNPRKTGV